MLPYTVWSPNCYPQFSFSHTCFFPCYFTSLLGFLILSNFSFNFMNNRIRSPKYLWSHSHFISLYFFTALFPSLEGCDAFPCFFITTSYPRHCLMTSIDTSPAWHFCGSPFQRFTCNRI